MKMQLFNKANRRSSLIRPGSPVLPVTAGVIILALILLIIRILAPGALTTAATPLWQLGAAASNAIGGAESLGENKEDVVRERDELKAEIEALKIQNQVATSEAAEVAKLVGTHGETERGILASVLARPPVSPYDTLVLDQGSNAGVTAGAFVFGPGGSPLGTIENVAPKTARALLYSAPGRSTQGWVGELSTPVTLVGASAGSFHATLPKDSPIAVGDLVYLPGSGLAPVGSVVAIDTNPSSPEVGLEIRPMTNIFSLTWVSVSTYTSGL
ncbi:MAG: Rod shape-determining protein MreC [Parcubacteria group bacterium]|nr:Rod shape-determining protein MreC [Parcubacteria group bacterium]